MIDDGGDHRGNFVDALNVEIQVTVKIQFDLRRVSKTSLVNSPHDFPLALATRISLPDNDTRTKPTNSKYSRSTKHTQNTWMYRSMKRKMDTCCPTYSLLTLSLRGSYRNVDRVCDILQTPPSWSSGLRPRLKSKVARDLLR